MEKEYDFMDYMPNSLNLDNSNLSDLASRAAVAIDAHIKNINQPLLRDYRTITRLGKIIFMASQPLPHNPYYTAVREDVCLSVFLARLFEKHTGSKPKTIDEVVDRTKEFGLQILKLRELPAEKQRRLAEFCLELSREARAYWHSQHPHGFKQYAA